LYSPLLFSLVRSTAGIVCIAADSDEEGAFQVALRCDQRRWGSNLEFAARVQCFKLLNPIATLATGGAVLLIVGVTGRTSCDGTILIAFFLILEFYKI
jgi:hypothetical protein